MYEVIDTDVLVVGGGGAGCRAAIAARDQGVSVVMIVKGRLGHSGCTFNVGTSAAVGPWGEPDDTPASAMWDLLAHGGFLGNQDLAKVLTDEALESVLELERWGIDFERNDDGSIAMHWSAAHTRTRNLAFKPRPGVEFDYGALPGFAMMDVLIGEVRKRDIRVMDDVTLVDLLRRDDRVVGAVTLDCANNRLLVFKARSTILATGTYGQIFHPTTVDRNETGDGQAAAFRAGAELIDMESTQFVATSVGFPEGTAFLNGLGEQFLETYGITDPRTVTKEELCYAIGREVREGRGTDRETIYLDMRRPLQEDPSSKIAIRVEDYVSGLDDDGADVAIIDPKKEPVESEPRAHTTIGGIRINTRCETNVLGLYAAGGVAGSVYGHARPEGYTSMITVVFGRRAGLYAAEWARTAGEPVLDEAAVQKMIDRATALVSDDGVDPLGPKNWLRSTIRKAAWVMKDEEGLTEGLETTRRIKASVTTLKATNGYEWESALELPNMLLCADLMVRCSLIRKESRGAFFRDDYPNTDNTNWLRNIIIKLADGETVVDTVPVDLKYCGPDPDHPAVSLHVGRWGEGSVEKETAPVGARSTTAQESARRR